MKLLAFEMVPDWERTSPAEKKCSNAQLKHEIWFIWILWA